MTKSILGELRCKYPTKLKKGSPLHKSLLEYIKNRELKERIKK